MQEFINKKFGKWTVLSYIGRNLHRRHCYKVKCECGNESVTEKTALTRHQSTQCRSCARKISASGEKNGSFKHGFSSINHPRVHMHYIWKNIKQRCFNPKVKNYHRYGGRGITMSQEWKDSFETFLKDMGERPQGYSIDRIDNDKGYCKENCQWVTKEENYNNTYKSIKYEFNGLNLSETQWAKEIGLPRNKIMYWARKNGIKWVIDNKENLKLTKVGMTDKEYLKLGLDLPSKRDRKL